MQFRRAIPLTLLIAITLATPGGAALLSLVGNTCVPGATVGPQCAAWEQIYETGGQDEGHAIALSADGATSFVVGSRYAGGGWWDRDALVLAYDVATGAPAWEAAIAGPTDGPNGFYGVAVHGQTVVAVGSHVPGESVWSRDALVAAFDAADGTLLWQTIDDVGEWDQAHAVAFSADGARVYVAGYASQANGGGSSYSMFALDAATGDILWRSPYVNPYGGTNGAVALGVADGDLVVVTGYEYAGRGSDIVTLALDGATGAVVWRQAYNGPGLVSDTPAALAIADGVVYVAGSSVGVTDMWGDFLVMTYDAATGAPGWVMRHDGPGLHYDGASSIAVAGDRVFATGIQRAAGGITPQHVTLALDAESGARVWAVIGMGPLDTGTSSGQSVVANADGSVVYVAASKRANGGSTDPVVLALDGGTGLEAWRGLWTPHETGSYDQLGQIVLAPQAGLVLGVGTVGDGEVTIMSGDAPAGPYPGELNGDVLTVAFRT